MDDLLKTFTDSLNQKLTDAKVARVEAVRQCVQIIENTAEDYKKVSDDLYDKKDFEYAMHNHRCYAAMVGLSGVIRRVLL